MNTYHQSELILNGSKASICFIDIFTLDLIIMVSNSAIKPSHLFCFCEGDVVGFKIKVRYLDIFLEAQSLLWKLLDFYDAAEDVYGCVASKC
jgi:hypothetical protein